MAVTAYPVVLVDSTNGAASDTACSGAGPATALTGTAGATDSGGTTVTLDAGTVLTGVATDGSHVILLRDTTAGHRQFAAINATAGSGGATPTVTVEQAFTGSLSGKSWAIGGVRATLFGSVSMLLFNNNGSAGDEMPQWEVQAQSGHTETPTTQLVPKRSGSTSLGRIKLTGTGATQPVVTWNTGSAIAMDVSGADFFSIIGFTFKNNNASTNYGVKCGNAMVVADCTIAAGSQQWGSSGAHAAVDVNTGVGSIIRNNDISGCYNGLSMGGGCYACRVIANRIHGCANHGINLVDGGGLVAFNLIYGCTLRGVDYSLVQNEFRPIFFLCNTVYNNGSDGIRWSGTGNTTYTSMLDNLLTSNGGYGLNFSALSDVALSAYGPQVRGNDTYNNTSGAYHSTTGGYTNSNCPWAVNDPGLNPQYANAGAGDFTPTNTSLKGAAYPTAFGAVTNYAYPGAIQPNAGGGSAGMLFVPNLEGT